MRRLALAALFLAGVLCEWAAVGQMRASGIYKLDGSDSGTTGTANRIALFGPSGTLTTDPGATVTGTGATLSIILPDTGTTQTYSSLGFGSNQVGWRARSATGAGYWTMGGADRLEIGNTRVLLSGTAQLSWDSGGASYLASGTPDLGLARASAGVLKVTDGSTGVGKILVADGSAAAPSYSFGSETSTGLRLRTTGTLDFQLNSSTNLVRLSNVVGGGSVSLGAGSVLFAAGSPETNSPDSGLSRSAAGVLKVTDGGTGYGKILVADGTAAAPSIAFAGGGGLFFNTDGPELVNAGGARIAYAGNGYFNLRNGVIFGTDGSSYISFPTAATAQLGKAPNATPVANTLIIGESGSGTNIAGANGTISCGPGTGSAVGCSLIFQTPTAHGSDAVAQTPTTRWAFNDYDTRSYNPLYPAYTDAYPLGANTLQWTNLHLSRATLGSKSKAITDNTATDFATFTIADGATYTGEVIYKVKSVKGTALQALAGRARFAATREGSTYTVAVSEVGTQTLAAATGTLTGAISIAGTAGVVTLTATFDTSQSSPDSMTIDWRVDSPDASLALTPL